MLELMKRQTTKGFAEIHISKIPIQQVDSVKAIIEEILDISNLPSSDVIENKNYSIEEVFPDFHHGDALRGFRTRDQLTQKELAEMIQVTPRYISELENGKSEINEKTAKCLAKVFNTDYRILIKG